MNTKVENKRKYTEIMPDSDINDITFEKSEGHVPVSIKNVFSPSVGKNFFKSVYSVEDKRFFNLLFDGGELLFSDKTPYIISKKAQEYSSFILKDKYSSKYRTGFDNKEKKFIVYIENDPDMTDISNSLAETEMNVFSLCIYLAYRNYGIEIKSISVNENSLIIQDVSGHLEDTVSIRIKRLLCKFI